MLSAGIVATLVWGAFPARTTAQAPMRTDLPLSAPPLPDLSIDDAAIAEGHDGTRSLVFVVRLSFPGAEPVTVLAATHDGTASTSDADFFPAGVPLVFAPGSVAESLVVTVSGDTKLERDEFFEVQLSDVVGAGLADSVATGTIANDDWASVAIDDAASLLEGDADSTLVWFTARLSEPALDSVLVDVATLDSTATAADGDYAPVHAGLVFPPGVTTATIAVAVRGDTLVEADEWLRVRLADPVGAILGDDEATVGILNDDLPILAVADTSIAEGHTGTGAMLFRVRLTPAVAVPVSFHYEVIDRTALASDGDYAPITGDTLFAPGEDQVVLAVPVFGDTLLEGNEVFTLRVTPAPGAGSGERQALGVIRNDERVGFEGFAPSFPSFGPGTLPPSFGDLDSDGKPDLLLYLNSPTGFVEMPGVRSMLGNGNYHGSAWCDYDRDGDMDVVQVPYPNYTTDHDFTQLLENTPEGLVDVGHSLGMDIVGFGETPAWGDFNADGWPDLFLPFYSHIEPYRSFFFLNLGNGQFLECADSAGVSLPNMPIQLRPEGVAVADWNGDGSLDFYCASHLFLNDGYARFQNVRVQVGLPVVFDEGANFVDYDDDGDLDLYLRASTGPTLYQNRDGTFVNVTATLGIGNVGWEWGDRWADLDGDGDLDLLYFPPGAVAHLVLNEGNGSFHEDTEFVGVLSSHDLAAFGDFDMDGDIDVAAGAYARRFARNRLDLVPRTRTSWLKVRVEDNEGMLTAHGATVRLRSLDDPRHPVQTRIVDGGSGYLGQDEYTITFGGLGSGAFDLEVSYPSTPGTPRVVGPAQNPTLAGLRPGDAAPQLLVVRPNGQVMVQYLTQEVAGVSTPPLSGGTLRAAIPNPARSLTRFYFSVPGDAAVSLDIHDLSGRRVRKLVHEGQRTGQSSIAWDLSDDHGRPVPAGLYFARLLRNGRRSATLQRVVVVR